MLLTVPWWGWTIILFLFTFVLGLIAVVAGVGGGVLYVPIVSALFPFHLDFVRGAGLMVALTGALSASPHLLRTGLASLRMALPFALVGSIASIFGAAAGLALSDWIVKTLMGATIVGIVGLMVVSKRSEFPSVKVSDSVSAALRIHGLYHETSTDKEVAWKIRRSVPALAAYVAIGFMGGMFGLGAGWANVPALNLLLGAPLRISVATSALIISVNSTAASWVYLNNGAVLPIIAVPSIAGMMLGTRIGARFLSSAKPGLIKWIVVTFLFAAGMHSLLEGIGVWS